MADADPRSGGSGQALRDLAASAPALPVSAVEVPASSASDGVRIGYACDSAFGFYYAGDLEALQAGAELVPFSPLRMAVYPLRWSDSRRRFPETHMDSLEQNAAMRAAVAAFIEHDGPVYAECGGLMYLCRSLTWEGKTRKMGGVIPAEVVMHAKPQGRGYVQLRETAPIIPGRCPATAAQPISAHEFHYRPSRQVPDRSDVCLSCRARPRSRRRTRRHRLPESAGELCASA